MTNFLEVGDVIELKVGMKIYASIPEKFIFSNKPLSNESRTTDIRIGEIRKNNISDWEEKTFRLTRSIKEEFERKFGVAPQEAIDTFVKEHVPKVTQETFNTSYFVGQYVVIETSLTGGSRDSCNPNNHYPDGHRVVCQKLKDGKFDPQGETISFYQSGSFTAMIEAITPLRKMKQTFVG